MASFTDKTAAYGEGVALTKEFFQAKAVMEKAAIAAAVFRQLNQEQVDRIVESVYKAGFNRRVTLAKMAQKETGMGVWQHKTLQHVFATQILHEGIKHEKTGGVFTQLRPTFILSSSPDGKHIIHESISTRHLLAIKRICRRRCNERWQGISGDNYLDERLSADEVAAIYNRNY